MKNDPACEFNLASNRDSNGIQTNIEIIYTDGMELDIYVWTRPFTTQHV